MRLSPEAKVGTTIALSLVLLASMIMAVGRVDFRRTDGFEVHVVYTTVDGLREGAAVRFAGVHVGKVSFVQLEPRGVRVGVRIDRDLVIPADSRFTISTTGVLGDKHIEIYPGFADYALPDGSVVAGVSPVMMDSILEEMHTTLQTLNRTIRGFATIADSEELRASISESSILLGETISGLRDAMHQVTAISVSVNEVTAQVSQFAGELPQLELTRIARDVQELSRNLAALDLHGPVDEINRFAQKLNRFPVAELAADLERITKTLGHLDVERPLREFGEFTGKLNQLPLAEVTRDLQTVSGQMAALDLAGMEREIRLFTSMLSRLELEPIVDELGRVTKQLAQLDMDQRAQDIALFTQRLADFPLEQLALDLTAVSRSLQALPFTEVATDIQDFSRRLGQFPIDDLARDLQVLMSDLASLGLTDMAQDIAGFTQQLHQFDVGALVEAQQDIQRFTGQLGRLDVEPMFGALAQTVDHLKALTQAVEPEVVTHLVVEVGESAAHMRQASQELGTLVKQLTENTEMIGDETVRTVKAMAGVVSDLRYLVADVHLFMDDLIADGETTERVKQTLANVEQTTADLQETIGYVTSELPSAKTAFDGLRSTMTSIQKINEDLQTLRGMGEKVDVASHWGLSYGLKQIADDEGSPLSADVRFEFHPEEDDGFFVVGWTDLGNDNNFQLQYGSGNANVRQRYGIIDTRLGVGIDGRVTDRWGVTAELRDSSEGLKLRLRADYQWSPDWWMSIKTDDIFEVRTPPVSFGVERRF